MSRGVCAHMRLVLREASSERKSSSRDRKEGSEGMRGVCMCVIWDLALGGRLGVTLNATAGLLEVIVVDANSELIVALL